MQYRQNRTPISVLIVAISTLWRSLYNKYLQNTTCGRNRAVEIGQMRIQLNVKLHGLRAYTVQLVVSGQ